jgi:hypothetical protein
MAAGEKRDQHFANHIIVTDDDLLHLGLKPSESFLKLLGLHHTPLPIIG